MKFKLERYGIRVTPENEADEAYIEDTLGLKENGAAIALVRHNAIGLGAISCLETPSPYDRAKYRWFISKGAPEPTELPGTPSGDGQ
jgi:hypothetical protein